MVIPGGERIERLPAWIKRVTQDLTVSPVYDARFWNPPATEIYKFKNKSPPQPRSVKIYEAHVGISTSEGRVGTYKEFTENILPRIKKLGYNVIQLMAIVEHAYYACEFSNTVQFVLHILNNSHYQPLDIKSRAFLQRALVTAPQKS